MNNDDALKLLAAGKALQNQQEQINQQRALLQQSIDAQETARRGQVLGKLTELVMEGVESNFGGEVFRRKLSVYLRSSPVEGLRPAVLQELLKASGSLVVLALETWAEEADSGGLNEHPLEILSEAHEHGWYGLTADPGKARAWAQRGAERGITSCERKAAAYLGGSGGTEDLTLAEDYARRAAQKGDAVAVALWAEIRLRRSGKPAEIVQILRDGLSKCSEGPDRAVLGGLLADLDEAWPPTYPQWRERILLWLEASEHGRLSAGQTLRLAKILLAALRMPDRSGIRDQELITWMRRLCGAAQKANFSPEVNNAVAELEGELVVAAKAEEAKLTRILLLITVGILGFFATLVLFAIRR